MVARYAGLMVALAIWFPVAASAQTQASVVGTVIDDSKAVLPGVTVTAIDLAGGRRYVAQTDERGNYRLGNLAPGTYRIEGELAGFATASAPSIELLVGQNVTMSFTLKVATLKETVTVTSEAALVDTVSSQVAGNVDRRQMDELPILGRNWMELGMLVKGVTANSVSQYEPQAVARNHEFQLNLDGQQITQLVASSAFGQPRLSREAIAEFQIATNLFDITQGRSVGIQVQAISRSGSNALSGSAYGNIRDDRFNAADHLAKRVLPFQNQQFGGAVGGPIVRNKTHYFFTYEYERQPGTTFSQPPRLPNQSFTFATKDTHHTALVRVDHELSPTDRLMARGSIWDFANPFTGGDGASEIHPSEGAQREQSSNNVSVSWTRLLSNNLVQEVRIGRSGFAWGNNVAVQKILELNTPSYSFPGLYVGGRLNYNQDFAQETWSFRYDLAWHRGAHDLKFGAEFLRWHDVGGYRPARNARGQFVFHSAPPDLERRFPADAWDDPTRWDVTGLEPYVTRFDQSFGDGSIDIPRPNYAIWLGDTWRSTDRLTVNYGVRYDLDWGMLAPPRLEENPNLHKWQETNIRDLDNFAPRGGFNYRVTENSDFVIRGGSGMYYGTHNSNFTFDIQRTNSGREVVGAFLYDGKPGFMQDPRRGVTGEDILSGRVPSPPVSHTLLAPDFQFPRSWQNMLGFQKQLSQVLGVEADLTYTQFSHELRARDRNLFQDPVTGYSLNQQVHGRPFPLYEGLSWRESTGVGHEVALATGLTRRYRNNFQGGATYTLMLYKKDDLEYDDEFDLDPPLSTSNAFQRHTLRLNGIYQFPWGFNLSGAYFFGSGTHYATAISGRPFGSVGGSRLNAGGPIEIPERMRDRFDGPPVIGTMQFVPRNALKGTPLHKVDLRISKDFRLGGNVKLTGMIEGFNVLNHANYGTFVTSVNLRSFGEPRQRPGNAYVPRMGQLAFRLTF